MDLKLDFAGFNLKDFLHLLSQAQVYRKLAPLTKTSGLHMEKIVIFGSAHSWWAVLCSTEAASHMSIVP